MSSDRKPLLPTHSSKGSLHKFSAPPIRFPQSSSTSALGPADDDEGEIGDARTSSSSGPRTWQAVDRVPDRRQGLPKLSRECLWSEIKCYGSYILPVFLVFGVLVIGLSLGIVGWKRGWFHHEDPHPLAL